jgi:hypothetical protein
MKIIISENQYNLILESKELVSSFDKAISNLAKANYFGSNFFNLGTEGRPWWAFLVFDKKNRKKILKSINDWKINNDVDISISDENSLRNNNHRHGISLYNDIKNTPSVREMISSSQLQNPDSIAVFISPKKEIVDTTGKVFYHTSNTPDLDKIGLKPFSPNMKYTKNIYFWDDIATARFYGANNAIDYFYIYKVNLDGYDVFKDTEELYDAYFINLPVSPNRVELVESHNKFDEKKVNAYEKKNKEIEEKIKRFGIKSSKILPYIKYVKKGFDMCETFNDGEEYGEYIINSALEILFKEISEDLSSDFGFKVQDLCGEWFFHKLVMEFEDECF